MSFAPGLPGVLPPGAPVVSIEGMKLDLIIVGGGIAGCAAALRASQNGMRALWIRGTRIDAKRSRGHWVVNIDNMVGVHEGIVRPKLERLLGRGEQLASARDLLASAPPITISTRDIIMNVVDRLEAEPDSQVQLLEETATEARRTESGFEVTANEVTYSAPALVLATGVMDRQPSIMNDHKGETSDDIKWIYPAANREQVLYCIRCEGHLTRKRRVAVVGSGPAAAEIAMMLHERYGSAELILLNGEEPTWSPDAAAALAAYGIEVHAERITDVEAKRDGLRAVTLTGDKRFELDFMLVSLGLFRVYNDLAIQLNADLADEGRPTEERHVRIDARGETTVEDLFCVGDMSARDDEPVMKQVYTCQEYAVRAVDAIDRRRRKRLRAAAVASA